MKFPDYFLDLFFVLSILFTVINCINHQKSADQKSRNDPCDKQVTY